MKPSPSSMARLAAAGLARQPQRQRGAATLIVVMVLFFVMSLVAAYSSRNILFEQRTSANQYVAMVSLEAADAGLEWALGMLNGSRIDTNCAPSAVVANSSFRQRYLQTDPVTGNITVLNSVRDGPLWPTCWHDRTTNQWTCHCPSGLGSVISSTPADAFAPSFRVRFIQMSDAAPPAKPGIVAIEVNGCTGFDAACLNFQPFAAAPVGVCRGTVCAQVALASGMKSLPVAALTARQAINVVGPGLTVANARKVGGTGITAMAGGAINTLGMNIVVPPPGTQAQKTNSVVANDSGLSNALFTPERMFASIFGTWPSTYVEQPGAVRINCAAACDSTVVRAAVDANPGRVFVLQGDVALDGGAPIGTAADPVVLMVTGSFTFAAPTEVNGLVYARAANWTTAGLGTINGAAVGEGNIGGTGAFTVNYDEDILNRLRWTVGSFVKVPGSWKDFP